MDPNLFASVDPDPVVSNYQIKGKADLTKKDFCKEGLFFKSDPKK